MCTGCTHALASWDPSDYFVINRTGQGWRSSDQNLWPVILFSGLRMPTVKPWLSFAAQAQKMLDRGMRGDLETIATRLQHVNYYRLLGYSFPFRLRRDAGDRFAPGLSFETVWEDYVFDQKLRVLVMDAIERIEVAARTQIAYHHAQQFGPIGYAENPASLPNLRDGHGAFLARLRRCVFEARHQQYIKAFKRKHRLDRDHEWSPPPWPAIWVTCETMSIGNIVVMYQGCHDRERERIAAGFALTPGVMESWLLMFQLVRNICAHHSRLWNRPLAKSPQKPPEDAFPGWYSPVPFESPKKVFGALSATACVLSVIAPGSSWTGRVKALLADHPAVPVAEMGFPDGWESSPIWH